MNQNQQQNNLSRPGQEIISSTDLLKNTWDVYKNNFAIFVGIMAIPFLAGIVIALALVFLAPVLRLTLNWNSWLPFFSLIIVLIPLIGILALWPQLALLYAIKERKQKISIKQAFQKSWHKIISYWWITILSGIITLGGLILLIVPGIIFAIWFSLASYILIAEEKRGLDALKRSKELIKGNWFNVAWRFLLLGFVLIVILLPISFILETLNLSLLQSVISLLIAPLGPIFGFLLYEDLKRLKSNV